MAVFVISIILITCNTLVVGIDFVANCAAAIHIDASVVRINHIADCTPSIRIGVRLRVF